MKTLLRQLKYFKAYKVFYQSKNQFLAQFSTTNLQQKKKVGVPMPTLEEIERWKEDREDYSEDEPSYPVETLESYEKGNCTYYSIKHPDGRLEYLYDYFSDDEELCMRYNPFTENGKMSERDNFDKLDDKQLNEQFQRGELRRTGSIMILYLGHEIMHRFRHQLILKYKNKKEKFVSKKLRNEGENESIQKAFRLMQKYSNNNNLSQDFDNVYINHEPRIELKSRFHFDDEFWEAIKAVDDHKLQGTHLKTYLDLLTYTLCQRADLWLKFVKALENQLRQLDDTHIKHKPISYLDLLSILRDVDYAYTFCGGLNMPLHTMSYILLKYKHLIADSLFRVKMFPQYAKVLRTYKFYTRKEYDKLGMAGQILLETQGKNLSHENLLDTLTIYSYYYDDSNQEEFSILEGLLIESSKLKKINILESMRKAEKYLPKSKIENYEMISAQNETYSCWIIDVEVLRIFSLCQKRFPYKYLESMMKDLIQIDYTTHLGIVLTISQLLARFSFYDKAHYEKLKSSLSSINLSSLDLKTLLDLFVLTTTTNKLDKTFMETSYNLLAKLLGPHMNKDTPFALKQPLKYSEVFEVEEDIKEYYHSTLAIKSNPHYKLNEGLFGEVVDMIFTVAENMRSEKNDDEDKNL